MLVFVHTSTLSSITHFAHLFFDSVFELKILSHVNRKPGLAVQARNPSYTWADAGEPQVEDLGTLVRPCLKMKSKRILGKPLSGAKLAYPV